MKLYDFEKARRLVEEHKPRLESAALGMREDWFWTGMTVWEEGCYVLAGMEEGTTEEIAGIPGSFWATPTLELKLRGEEGCRYIPCYTCV